MSDDAMLPMIAGYRSGTWKLDPKHSEIRFTIRHMMISKVHGRFAVTSATFLTKEDPFDTEVSARVEVSSLDTGEPNRDRHLLSADFFDAERFPVMEFRSTGTRRDGEEFLVDGVITIRDVARPVTFRLEFGGFGDDPYGGYRAGATAKTTIDREEFGLTWNSTLETGGVLIGRDVAIELDLEAVLQGS